MNDAVPPAPAAKARRYHTTPEPEGASSLPPLVRRLLNDAVSPVALESPPLTCPPHGPVKR